MVIRPLSCLISPEAISTKVVLPAPLWPTRPTISPAATCRLKPSSALTAP